MTGHFQTPLELRRLDGDHDGRKWWALLSDFTYVDEDGQHYTAPAGTLTDFASIPRAAWMILPPDGAYTKAAVIHDWLCEARPIDSATAHGVFRRAMRACGVRWLTRQTMWSLVRVCGPRFEAEA